MNGVMHNETDPVKIYFAGNHLSTRALNALVDRLENIDFSINIVSKSGSTMETAVAARMFRWLLNRKYGRKGQAADLCDHRPHEGQTPGTG